MKKYFFILIFFLGLNNAVHAQTSLELALEEKQAVLDYARLVLDRNDADAEDISFSDKLKSLKNPVIMTFFDGKGNLISTERENDSTLTLQQKLERLTNYFFNHSLIFFSAPFSVGR